MSESWKPIPGFEGYEASDLGRVRSLDKEVRTARNPNMTRIRKGKILKPIQNRGWLFVKLGGPNKCVGVHQAVALAFYGLPPDGHVVDHKNTNKHDNTLSNIEYVTNSENVKRQYRNGLLTNQAGKIGRWSHLPAKEVSTMEGV